MKKAAQLGMNPGTASYRLVKDLLFKYVSEANHVCFRCGGQLTRNTFSIEHVKPWLDSEDPKKLFFDLDNIAFSHRTCNSANARKPTKTWTTDDERKSRAAELERTRWSKLPKEEQQRIRKNKYVRNGK